MLGGGPCAFNPEPYAPFFDALSIGEGEEALPEGLALIRRLRAEGARRADILRALAREAGWYVPALYRWLSEEEAQRAGAWAVPLEAGARAHREAPVRGVRAQQRMGAVHRAVHRGGAR